MIIAMSLVPNTTKLEIHTRIWKKNPQISDVETEREETEKGRREEGRRRRKKYKEITNNIFLIFETENNFIIVKQLLKYASKVLLLEDYDFTC